MLFYTWPRLEELFPRAANTIRKWVMDDFKARKITLQKDLMNAISAINLSFDLWTSPNGLSIIAIVGHYIDGNGFKQYKLLGLREVFGQHSGKNIAEAVICLIKEYNIAGKLGCFVSDNAESNDVAVEAILKYFFPNISAKKRKERRIRCFGHIVNLSAQAFVIGNDSEKITKEIDRAIQDMDFKTVRKLWKKLGAIGLFQNLIRYIRASPQRRQYFRHLRSEKDDEKKFDGLEVIIYHII